MPTIMTTTKNTFNTFEFLHLKKNLPFEVVQIILCHAYKGDGITAIQSNYHWLFCMDEFYPLSNAKETFDLAIKEGLLQVVQYMYVKEYSNIKNQQVFDLAVEYGHVDVVDWLFKQGKKPQSKWECVRKCLRKGNLTMLKWLHSHDLYVDRNLNVAVGYGHFDIVKWLIIDLNEKCDDCTLGYAAEKDDIKTLCFLHKHTSHTFIGQRTAMFYAARNGHLEILNWLNANHYKCDHLAMNTAAANGQLEALQWLHANRREGCTERAMYMAAVNGHLEVVQWLHANRSEGCIKTALEKASENGHRKLVKWLKKVV